MGTTWAKGEHCCDLMATLRNEPNPACTGTDADREPYQLDDLDEWILQNARADDPVPCCADPTVPGSFLAPGLCPQRRRLLAALPRLQGARAQSVDQLGSVLADARKLDKPAVVDAAGELAALYSTGVFFLRFGEKRRSKEQPKTF
jgi:hypothetical protein